MKLAGTPLATASAHCKAVRPLHVHGDEPNLAAAQGPTKRSITAKLLPVWRSRGRLWPLARRTAGRCHSENRQSSCNGGPTGHFFTFAVGKKPRLWLAALTRWSRPNTNRPQRGRCVMVRP